MCLPKVLGRSRRMLILWDTIDAHKWIRINDGQVGREALLHNVAIVDLCSLFRFAVCGWAGLTRNNAVNNVSVHSEAQVRLVSVAELRCALTVLSRLFLLLHTR